MYCTAMNEYPSPMPQWTCVTLISTLCLFPLLLRAAAPPSCCCCVCDLDSACSRGHQCIRLVVLKCLCTSLLRVGLQSERPHITAVWCVVKDDADDEVHHPRVECLNAFYEFSGSTNVASRSQFLKD